MVVHGRPVIILLVEDDQGDQELTRRAMMHGKIKNDLHIVENGEEALDYLFGRGRYRDREKYPLPDLILLDLNIPRLDGKQVLKAVQADPVLRRIPVVVLTTSYQDADIQQAYESGAKSYIVKPVDIDQFTRVVQAIEEYWFQIVILPPVPR